MFVCNKVSQCLIGTLSFAPTSRRLGNTYLV